MHSQAFLFLSFLSAVRGYTVIVSETFMHKNVDPIVMPGRYTSHMHTFFGSDAVTTYTNSSAELRKGCTSAENPNDLSAYWIPTLYYTGGSEYEAVDPMRFSAYYENIGDAEIPIPENFKALSGKASATQQSEMDELAQISWACEGDPSEDKDDGAFPSTTCSTHLQELVYFPDCVDPNDVSKYGRSGTQNWSGSFKPENRCPAGMKRIPRLRFSIRYDLRDVISDGWSGEPPLVLASGNSYSAHGDFINGWTTDAAENMMQATDKREFMGIDGSRGTAKAGIQCSPEDADPSHGTSDYETSVTMMNSRRTVRWAA